MRSIEAGGVMAKAFQTVFPDAGLKIIPAADGGEGTAQTLTDALGGTNVSVKVTGPLGDPVTAYYGLIENGDKAVMDMAQASGITLVKKEKLNPMKATTYGTGEMILSAVKRGVKEIIIGVGGSATVDGGSGMVRALGFELLDENGCDIGNGARGLLRLKTISTRHVPKALKKIRFRTASDVTNILCGPKGAAAVFGPQKGADSQMIPLLEKALTHYAEIVKKSGLCGSDQIAGDGAAGGLGFALRAFLSSKTESGAELVASHTGFYDEIKEADLLITGEGKTDAQSADGKLCAVLARIARKQSVPVILISGAIRGDFSQITNLFDAAFATANDAGPIEEAIAMGKETLSFTSYNAAKVLKAGILLKTQKQDL